MDFNEEIALFLRHYGLDPEMVGCSLQVAGILLFVISILWFIFPWLPDHPPKKKPRV